MNCLTMALWVWIRSGFKGHIGILKWGRPFPHFAVFESHCVIHWRAIDESLPWYRQLHFAGEIVHDWTGPSNSMTGT